MGIQAKGLVATTRVSFLATRGQLRNASDLYRLVGRGEVRGGGEGGDPRPAAGPHRRCTRWPFAGPAAWVHVIRPIPLSLGPLARFDKAQTA